MRREEVAELAGVSAKWYAAFEAGSSERRFSAEFVHRVAEALQLDARDRVWLFRLALPEAAAVAEHFEAELLRAEDSLREARAAAVLAVASAAIYNQLAAQESARAAQAAAGREPHDGASVREA